MSQEDERFLQQLLATFRVEAEEHLGAMSSRLLALERLPPGGDSATLVETLFREAHSLKGAARAVNLADVEHVCQALERVLSALKRRELAASREVVDTLHHALDGLTRLLGARLGSGTAPDPQAPVALVDSLDVLLAAPAAEVLAAAAPPALPPLPPQVAASAPVADETVRVSTSRLEALMTQAEELQAFKFGAEHLAAELRGLADAAGEWRRQADKTARAARALRRAAATAGEPGGKPQRRMAPLIEAGLRDELFAKSLLDRLGQLARVADRERRGLAQRVDRLQTDMRQVLMLPFAGVLSALPRLVRDLSQASGKEVELVLSGTTLQADRRVLERLKTPLNHLVRNAIDHGIEPPRVREQAGKPPRGRLAITIVPREGHRIEMTVSDDGAGIALPEVEARAQRMGLLDAGASGEVTSSQIGDLVFASGLSTSPLLTDLSGHGLGLAIAREKIEALGGTITLQPPPGGIGTSFCIVLPATLATYRGLLVAVDERSFVLPSRHVERVGRVPEGDIRRAPAGDAVTLNGELLPLVALAAVLELPVRARWEPARDLQQVVVVSAADRRIALAVDEVIGDQEVLVKPLVPPLRRVRHIAGATLLAEGRVVPLLDVGDLVKSALRGVQRRTAAPHDAPRASLLLAEDSVTSRELLRHVLESAGYRVTTAADGIDALARLQSGRFDLLVSDVEMPRLDGFDLTTRVRSDRRLAGLPIVLLTALESRADAQRGADVGANAYLVKRAFDSRRLLDTIGRLV